MSIIERCSSIQRSLFGGLTVLQTQIGLSSVLSKELDNSVFSRCLLNQALQSTHGLLSTIPLQPRMEFRSHPSHASLSLGLCHDPMSAGNALFEYENIQCHPSTMRCVPNQLSIPYEHFLEHGVISSTTIYALYYSLQQQSMLLLCTTDRADLLLIGVCVCVCVLSSN